MVKCPRVLYSQMADFACLDFERKLIVLELRRK
jgi:hypothetical protein